MFQAASDKGVRVEPKGMSDVTVGLYEASFPRPRLWMCSDPDLGDLVAVSREWIEEDGDYRLVCHVQNFGDQPCEVTISTKRGSHHGREV